MTDAEQPSFPTLLLNMLVRPLTAIDQIANSPSIREALPTYLLVTILSVVLDSTGAERLQNLKGLPIVVNAELTLVLLAIPLVLGGCVLVPGIAHLTGHLLNKENRLKSWKPVLGVYLATGIWLSLARLVPSQAISVLATIWMYVMGVLAFYGIYRLSWLKSLLATIIAVVCVTVVSFVILMTAGGSALSLLKWKQ